MSDKPLLSETEDRYKILGLRVVNRETGKPETYIALTRDEIDMPGYVESVQRGYEGSQWYAEPTRKSKTTVEWEIANSDRLDPMGMLTDEQVEEQARAGHGHVRPLYRGEQRIQAKCPGPRSCPVCIHEKRLVDAGVLDAG